jgi:hypothetical protein
MCIYRDTLIPTRNQRDPLQQLGQAKSDEVNHYNGYKISLQQI